VRDLCGDFFDNSRGFMPAGILQHQLRHACPQVTRYNDGLFNPQMLPAIEQWRVSDKARANVLRQLIFAQPPARSSARQQQIAKDEAIDYGLLESGNLATFTKACWAQSWK
jgi:hypothetical protein